MYLLAIGLLISPSRIASNAVTVRHGCLVITVLPTYWLILCLTSRPYTTACLGSGVTFPFKLVRSKLCTVGAVRHQ